jgi:hypothetical protein
MTLINHGRLQALNCKLCVKSNGNLHLLASRPDLIANVLMYEHLLSAR